MLNSSIWPIDRTLPDATTPGQSVPASDGKEEVLRIPPPKSSINGASPSNCLVSYPNIRWGWVLSLCRDAVSAFYNHSRQGYAYEEVRIILGFQYFLNVHFFY